MDVIEKQINYRVTNTYNTLNQLTDKTKNIWIVFHGIGYLGRYFLKYFDQLNADENYIIAPQAASKYYLNNEYRHVGASWLTKENTQEEVKNIYSYLDAVIASENLPPNIDLIVFGYSQGVSVASRWVVHNKPVCKKLVLYAGVVPNELTPTDFEFLISGGTEVTFIVGDQDEYLTEVRRTAESQRIKTLFQAAAKEIVFEGRHEVKKEFINSLT
tara:strand:+ start:193 stop:837 length:645 start_codon:yes stop_codon:yes gene_type:complete